LAGLKALGQKYRELDLDRVGIFGWSFGGYLSALAVMKEPATSRLPWRVRPRPIWLDYDTHLYGSVTWECPTPNAGV